MTLCRRTVVTLAAAVTIALPGIIYAAGNEAKGAVVYKARTANVKYAYLIKGPDAVSKQPIRRIIKATVDASPIQ